GSAAIRVLPLMFDVRCSMFVYGWHSFRVTNPEGWEKVAGGRSLAETPGRRWMGPVHPERMPEVCDPCGVGAEFFTPFRGYRSAALRSTPGYRLASLRLACRGIPEDEPGWCTGRADYTPVCIWSSVAAGH